MSYQATVFKVMIASPSDVKEEREIFREVIAEWNVVNADSREVVLLPVGWETHSYSEMGDRPQAIINKQILKDCDLVVGVFKTRFGTSTGKYNSGTIEEIEEHIKTNKPAMLYFGPISRADYNKEQYEQLEEFRKSFTGLYCDYKDENDFKDKFSHQLSLKLNDNNFYKKIINISNDSNNRKLKNIVYLPQTTLDTLIPFRPELSKEARIILKKASEVSGPHNEFIVTRKFPRRIIIGDSNIVPDQEGRTIAIWFGAIDELEENGLIDNISGFERNLYMLTQKGYERADLIEL